MKLLAFALALIATTPAYAVGTQGYVNVRDYGALGNGVADDAPAIQHVIDNVVADRGTIYFPAGDYKVGATINCGGRAFNFRGDGRPMPYNVWFGGSFIRGNFAAPVLQSFYPAGNLSIQDMGFTNWHAQGQGLLLSGSNVALLRVGVQAYRAIEMAPSAFTTSMQQIVVRGPAGAPVGSVGIAIRGHALLHGADIVGFDVGLRVAGIGNDIRSLRVEVNRTGIEVGVNPDGTNNTFIGSALGSLSLEANLYGIVVRVATSSSIRDVLIQGSVNSPSLQARVRERWGREIAERTMPVVLSQGSWVGVHVGHSQWVHYEQVITGGTFTQAAIRVSNTQPTTVPVRFTLCKAGNGLPAPALGWDLARPPDANLVLEQCS